MGKNFIERFKSNFKSNWLSTSSVIIVVITLLGGGYGAGSYLSDITCAREKLIITEEYQEKIYQHRATCNYDKFQDLEKKTNEIEMTIEQLKKFQNEK